LQVDGKILAGGDFSTIGGQARNLIARLDPTTGLADSFSPAATDLTVRSIAVQADGKVLVGGIFTTFAGQARTNMARLDPTNGLADSFAPNPDGLVYSIAVQADGRILAGGMFTTLATNGGDTVTRNYIARFAAPPPLLNIQRSVNTDVVLSWATNFTGFTLEASTNFNTNVWSAVSPAPTVSGANHVVTNTINGAARFYRLRN